MALFVLAVNKGLCATFRTVFIIVRLVHKEPVHAQLFKRHHIVLAVLGLQLFQPRLQRLFRAFQLLDGEPFPAAGLHLSDALGDFPNLLMQQPLLAFLADGDFLELGVTHDDGCGCVSQSPFWS